MREEGGPEVEAGVDSLTLSCRAHGNPRPDVVWRKLGQNSIFSLGEELSFQPEQVMKLQLEVLEGQFSVIISARSYEVS